MIVNEISFTSNTEVLIDVENVTALSIKNLSGESIDLSDSIVGGDASVTVDLSVEFNILTATYIIIVETKDYYITNLNVHNMCLLEGVLDTQIIDCEIVNTCEDCHEDIFKISTLLDVLSMYYLDYDQSIRILTELEDICEDCIECKEPNFIPTSQIKIVDNQYVV